MFFGGPNSGEAAVVGGDDLFGCSPPAEHPLTGAVPSGKGISSDQPLLFVKEIVQMKKHSFFHRVKWQFEERICYTFIIK
jgi:hypothetical protein